MRVGIQLPEVEREVRWPDREPRGPWEAWTLLGALAAATERVRLGPLVACAGFHPPGLIAKMAATIDEVSGGRFTLGLGAGWNREEYDAFGIPYDRRVARFEESFAIVRRLLDGERVTFDGRYFATDDAVLMPEPARPVPLMAGSIGPRMLGIMLPHVQVWNTWYTWYGNTAAGFRELNATIDGAAESAGREPRDIARSACVLVELDADAVRRPHDGDTVPVSLEGVGSLLDELADAGADEAILVLRPITEASIRKLGETLALA